MPQGFSNFNEIAFVVSATIKTFVKLQASVIKKIYSFIKKIHFDLFKKKKKNEVIFILHPPRSSYDTRKNFSKRGLHRVHFPKIFLNNYSTKHLKKNLLLKNFTSRLLYEGKSEGSAIENRSSLVL